MDYSASVGTIASVCTLDYVTYFRVVGRKDCRLASSSKDTTIKVWDTIGHRPIFTLSGHTAAVTCLRWGGKNWLYSGSQDKSIRIWDAKDVTNLLSVVTVFNPRENCYISYRHTRIGSIPCRFRQISLFAREHMTTRG